MLFPRIAKERGPLCVLLIYSSFSETKLHSLLSLLKYSSRLRDPLCTQKPQLRNNEYPKKMLTVIHVH